MNPSVSIKAWDLTRMSVCHISSLCRDASEHLLTYGRTLMASRQ